jgi:multicomponent Na+:H+ antiporter subunit D
MTMPVSLNPGFALLFAAGLTLIAPRTVRPILPILASMAAGFLALAPDFGAHDMFRQVGLVVVPLRLDAAAQVYGLAIAAAGIVLGLAASHRRDALEDFALMAHLGGAMMAIYGGDLVTFTVGAEISILAGAGLVLAGRTPAARAAAMRFAIWHALAGAAFVVGAGSVLAQTSDVRFDRISAATPAGAFVLIGCLIRAGAPLAHVWIKDCGPRASAIGFAALGPVTTALALYALVRLFPGEPVLAPIGAAGAAVGLFMAAAAAGPRTILAYATVAQAGLLVMALGVGAPLVMAGVSAAAFSGLFALVLAGLVVGWATREEARNTDGPLLSATAPGLSVLALVAAAALCGFPGFATYATGALLQDAIARQAPDWMNFAFLLVTGGVVAGAARAPLAALFGSAAGRGEPPPFSYVLGAALAAFFLVVIGAAPSWLFALVPPSPISFAAYEWDHLAARLQVVAAAGAVIALAAVGPVTRGLGRGGLVDVDQLYRGLGPAALGALGALSSAAFSAWTTVTERAGDGLARASAALGERLDRQTPPSGRRAAHVLLAGTAGVALVCFLAVLGSF